VVAAAAALVRVQVQEAVVAAALYKLERYPLHLAQPIRIQLAMAEQVEQILAYHQEKQMVILV
jgi:hypothetical protein